MILQESEVDGMKWVSFVEFKKMVESKDPKLVDHPREYELLFKYLKM